MRIIRFNLVPYRDQKVKKKQIYVLFEFISVLFFSFILAIVVTLSISSKIDKQVAYLDSLQGLDNEIASRVQHVEKVQAEVDELQRKVSALENVERESLDNSRLFSFIDQSLPSAVALSKINSNGVIVSVEGLTSSVADLASWVEVLESAKTIFSQAELVSVLELDENKRKNLPGYYSFSVKLRIQPLETANAQAQ